MTGQFDIVRTETQSHFSCDIIYTALVFINWRLYKYEYSQFEMLNDVCFT